MQKKSFNLIEVLIVVALIGVMAAFTYSYTQSARLRARDANRKNDVQSIRLVLNQFKQTYSVYPGTTASVNSYSCSAFTGGTEAANWTNLNTLLAPYTSKLPTDTSGQCKGGMLVSTVASKNPNGVYDYWVYTSDAFSTGKVNVYGVLTVLESKNSSVACTSSYANGGCHDLAHDTYNSTLSANNWTTPDPYIEPRYYSIGCQYDSTTIAKKVCPEKQ